MTPSRIASLCVAAAYLVAAFALRGAIPQVLIACVVIVILGLACIWFPDALGSYTGPPEFGSIQRSTPGLMIAIAGWVVLVIVPPVILVMTA
jgi:hypothetical protein